MSQYVLTIDLKNDPAAIAAYRAHHRHVWPEVVESLRRAGILKMDIYLLQRRGVMVLETDGRDPRSCFAAHVAAGPRVLEWEALMRSLQEAPPGAPPGEWWAHMELVFSLEQADAQPEPSPAGTHGRG